MPTNPFKGQLCSFCFVKNKRFDTKKGNVLHLDLFTSNVICLVAFFHDSSGIHNNVPQTDVTCQPDKEPPCQPAKLRQKCVGGGLDWRRSQDWAAGLLGFSWTPLCSRSPRWALSFGGTERWLKVWNSSHNWAEWAFVSWLITTDSWLWSPPSLHHPSALLCLASRSWKRYY